MKILFISPGLPLEYGSGGAIRSYQLYKELEKISEVDVLSATNWKIKPDMLMEFKGNYVGHIKIHAHPSVIRSTPSLSQRLREMVDLSKYDYVFVRYYNQAFWLGLFDLDNLILDCDDCHLEMFENEYRDEMRSGVSRLISYVSHRLMKDNYLSTLRRARKLIYSRHSKHSKLLPNACEIPNKLSPSRDPVNTFRPAEREAINVLFVGVLNYHPNVDGINHFLKHIWPDVVAKHPKAKFTIVGAHATSLSKRQWKLHKNVDVQGYVRDIEDAYRNADICIVPVYRGGGVHIKIMEALKYGKPVVMSDESQRGYHNIIKDGENAFIAESDKDFVSKLGQLIASKTLRDQMADKGNEVFHQSFSIDAEDPTMQNIIAGKI